MKQNNRKKLKQTNKKKTLNRNNFLAGSTYLTLPRLEKAASFYSIHQVPNSCAYPVPRAQALSSSHDTGLFFFQINVASKTINKFPQKNKAG